MQIILSCPNCKCEYVPSEIYMPDTFLGKVKDIEKDINGKILYQDQGDMNLDESYICDKCKKPFKVTCKLSFNTVPIVDTDFTVDHCTVLKKTSLFMKED